MIFEKSNLFFYGQKKSSQSMYFFFETKNSHYSVEKTLQSHMLCTRITLEPRYGSCAATLVASPLQGADMAGLHTIQLFAPVNEQMVRM